MMIKMYEECIKANFELDFGVLEGETDDEALERLERVLNDIGIKYIQLSLPIRTCINFKPFEN